MVQVGPGGDVADALILDSLVSENGTPSDAAAVAKRPQQRSRPKT